MKRLSIPALLLMAFWPFGTLLAEPSLPAVTLGVDSQGTETYSVSLQILAAMTALQGKPERLLVTGGLGAVDPLLQRLANVSGLHVERAQSSEATARGLACLLAGVPDNWPDAKIERAFRPKVDADLMARFERWKQLMPPLPVS